MGKRDGLRMQLHGSLKMEDSVPGWQGRLLERVAQLPELSRHGYAVDTDAHKFRAGRTLSRGIIAAAKQRGISKAGYIRRALGAFVAHDLGMTLAEVLEDGPGVSGFGSAGNKGPKNVHHADDGEGYGKWEVAT